MIQDNALEQPTHPDTNPVEQADIAVAKGFARHQHQPAVRAASVFSKAGNRAALLAPASEVIAWGFVTRNRRLAREGGHMLAAVLLATVMKTGMKRLVARSRPKMLFREGVHEVKLLGPNEGPWHSFPSGHAAGSAALARACTRCWPEARLPAYLGAAALAFARVPPGKHYPTDVVAGVLVGIAAAAIVDRVFPPD